ncbi:hypothetical protein, partial [Streptomyces zhihengii]
MNPRTALAATAVAALVTVLVLSIRYDGYFTDPAGLFGWIAIVTWIERTYHRRRRQATLGRLTPIEYETV